MRPIVEVVMLDLPAPISTNSLWRPMRTSGFAGMRLSKAYRIWKTEAGYQLLAQRPGRIEGSYALTLRVTAKWRGDLDNSIKATSDLLQEHGVISNDSRAQKIVIERCAKTHGMSVTVVSTKAVE